jgi:hypothetical protein
MHSSHLPLLLLLTPFYAGNFGIQYIDILDSNGITTPHLANIMWVEYIFQYRKPIAGGEASVNLFPFWRHNQI